MPNRREHIEVGAVAGALVALLRSDAQDSGELLLEVAGGALGGALGGRLPDILEPPTSPGHRGVAHAIIPVAAAGSFVVSRLPGASVPRPRAMERQGVQHDGTPASSLGERFLSGLAVGGAVGYASHLLMDSTTPRGLPLLG